MRVNLVDRFNRKISLDLSTRMTFILGLSGVGKTSLIRQLNDVVQHDIWDKSGMIKHLKINPANEDIFTPKLGTLIVLDEESKYIKDAWKFINNYKDVWVIIVGHGPKLQKLFNQNVGIAHIVKSNNLKYLEYLTHPDWTYIPVKFKADEVILVTEDSGSGEALLTQLKFKCIGAAGCQRVPRMINFIRTISDSQIIALLDEDTALTTLEFLCSNPQTNVYCFMHSSTEHMLLQTSPLLINASNSLKELSNTDALDIYRKYASPGKSHIKFTQENYDHAKLIYVIRECNLGFKLRDLKAYSTFTAERLGLTQDCILNYLLKDKELNRNISELNRTDLFDNCTMSDK